MAVSRSRLEAFEIAGQGGVEAPDGVGGRDGRVAVHLDELQVAHEGASYSLLAGAVVEIPVGCQYAQHDGLDCFVHVELGRGIRADQQARQAEAQGGGRVAAGCRW